MGALNTAVFELHDVGAADVVDVAASAVAATVRVPVASLSVNVNTTASVISAAV